MRKYLVLIILVFVSGITKAQQSTPFYIVNVAAVTTEGEAKTKAQALIKKGNEAGYLWIPDYASLSGAKFYSVYIGPYSTQYDCEIATENYRKINPQAYGLLVSQDNKRVQINGIGKVTVTEKSTANLQKNYKHLRGKYIKYLFGDVDHWIFRGENGIEYDFMRNKDQSYSLLYGDEINPTFKNKSFDVFYKSENVDFGNPGPGIQEALVIYKLKLVK